MWIPLFTSFTNHRQRKLYSGLQYLTGQQKKKVLLKSGNRLRARRAKGLVNDGSDQTLRIFGVAKSRPQHLISSWRDVRNRTCQCMKYQKLGAFPAVQIPHDLGWLEVCSEKCFCFLTFGHDVASITRCFPHRRWIFIWCITQKLFTRAFMAPMDSSWHFEIHFPVLSLTFTFFLLT